jgi:hypothetical protein
MSHWWTPVISAVAPLEENGGPGTWIAFNDVFRILTGTNGRLVKSPQKGSKIKYGGA